MTNHQDASARSDAAWRGRQVAAEAAAPEHQWEASPELQSSRPWQRSRSIRLGIWTVLFLLLLGGFIHRLLLSRPRVPVLAVFATEYDWPLPPNAWAHEDLQGLLGLDNLQLFDSSPAWRSRDSGMREFNQLMDRIRDEASRAPVIVYVSMHSSVASHEGEETPYLLPPGCNPLDETTWLPLRDVLRGITQKTPNRDTLLVLDCQRRQTNFHMGQLTNRFVDLIPQAIKETGAERVTVITAADSGQQSWASSGLQGSAFAQAFRRGLAGAADREQGDNNGWVSVVELHEYLNRQVSQWAAANRAAVQSPQLIAHGAESGNRSVEIAWTIRTALPASRGETTEPDLALDSLWQRNEALKRHAIGQTPFPPFARFPTGWQNLQHDLIMLEELASAGPGHAKRVADLAEKIKQQLDEVERILKSSRSTEDVWQSLAHASMPIGGEISARSLPMSSLLGTLSSADRQQLQAAIDHFQRQPTTTNLAEAMERVEQNAANGVAVNRFVEVHRLRLLEKYIAPSSWSPTLEVQRILALLGTAETASTPTDYRVWRWLRDSIEEGDHFRRPVEDTLLSPESIPVEQLEKAENRYADAKRERERVEATLQVRDRIWDEALYLSQWFLRFGAHQRPADQRDVPSQLAELIRGAHALDRAIAAGGSLDSYFDESGELAVARQWRTLQSLFADDVAQLAELDRPSPGQTRDIQCALRLPILPAVHRSRLRAVLSKFVERQAGRTSESQAAGADQPIEYPVWVERYWRQHPAALLLATRVSATVTNVGLLSNALDGGAETSLNPSLTSLDASMELFDSVSNENMSLVALGDQIRERLRAIVKPMTVIDGEAPPLETLAENARIGAAFGASAVRIDPVAKLWRRELRQFFLWQARRATHDLLGPVKAGESPFFVEAARAYRTNAEMLEPLSAPELQKFHVELDQLIRRLPGALTVKAKAQLLTRDDPSFAVDYQVQPGESPFRTPADATTPLGLATVLIRNLDESTVSVGELAQVDEVKEAMVDVDSQIVKDFGPQLQAVAVLRGHEYMTQFEVEGLSGLRIQFDPPSYDRTQVVVRPSKRKGKSIVFALDCSASMAETLAGEAASDEPSRLAIAKSRLQGVLDQIVREGTTRVGVRFFGHRVGWTPTPPLKTLVQEGYLKTLLKDVGPTEQDVLERSIRSLPPSQDVEAVLRPGVFGVDELQQVRLRMKALAPWGQSPLYLTLIRAIEDLDGEPDDYEKSIVVITDGLNYQWTPQDQRSIAPANTTLQNVMQQSQQSPAPIFIVGFGVRAEERQQAEAVYTELTRATGGEFISVDRADDLLPTLQGVLRQATYRIRDESGRPVGLARDQTNAAKIGEPLVVRPTPQSPTPFIVELPDVAEQIDLEGGEAVELQLDADGRLESVPFEEMVVATSATINGLDSPTGHVVRVHQPRSTENGLEFSLSLQHAERLVTPRPKDVWIEIQPLENGQPSGGAYVVYDPQFAPNQPVPLIVANLEGWPTQAPQALVRCWFRDEPAKHIAQTSLGAVVDSPRDFYRFQPIPGVDGCEYQVKIETTELPGRPFRVRVVQQYASDQAPVRPWLDCHDLRLIRVVRQFDPKHKLDSHSFFVDAASVNQLRNCSLRFTTQDAVKAESIRAAQPLPFSVYGQQDTLRLNPAQ